MVNRIFGKKSILEALENNLPIVKIVSNKNQPDILNIISNKTQFMIEKNDFFNQFDKTLNHQFCVAFLKENSIRDLSINHLIEKIKKQDEIKILILDEIEDPRNFGAIIRTSVCFGVDAIIYKNKNQVQINDLTIKSSMGAIYYIDMYKVANLSNIIEKLKDVGVWIYASILDEDALDFNKIEFDKKSAIIVGNENLGITNIVIKNSDFKVFIPISKIDSLNVSVATGILLNKLGN